MNADDQRLAEMGLLGEILSGTVDRLTLKMIPLDYFIDRECRTLYAALQAAYEENGLTDDGAVYTVAWNSTGSEFFNECVNASFHNCGAEFGRLLASEYLQRKTNQIFFNGKDDPDGLNRIIELISNLEKLKSELGTKKITSLHEKFIERLNSEIALMKVSIPLVDEYIGGLVKGEVTIIAGGPSMGKTAYACTLAYNLVSRGNPVDVFSFEMEDVSWYRRIVARIGNVPIWKIRNHSKNHPVLDAIEFKTCIESSEHLNTLPLKIETTGGLGIDRLTTKMATSQASVIVVDYLGLVGATAKGSLNEKAQEVSRKINGAAHRYGKAVLLLCQINRESRKTNSPPQLHDLRDSGAIEQDADGVQFIHEPELDINRKSKLKIVDVQVIIAKMRDGQTGRAALHHARDYSHFYEPAPEMPKGQYIQENLQMGQEPKF